MATKKTARTPRPASRPKEVTVKKVLSTWQAIATMVTATAVIGSAAVWVLSTQFARTIEVKEIRDTQTQAQYRLETKDLELAGSMALMKVEDANLKTENGSIKSDVNEVKLDIKEIRKDQQQTNENLIRLMERFSVQPAPKK